MTLAHDVHGDGPPLLLVDGITLDRRMWEPNMAALTARHRVVRCDLRGFGKTPPPEEPYSDFDVLALAQSRPAGRPRARGGWARRRGSRADARAVG